MINKNNNLVLHACKLSAALLISYLTSIAGKLLILESKIPTSKTKIRTSLPSICTSISSIRTLKTKIPTLTSSIRTSISSICTLKTKIPTLISSIRTLKTKIRTSLPSICTLKKWFQKVQKVACSILIHFIVDNELNFVIRRKSPFSTCPVSQTLK